MFSLYNFSLKCIIKKNIYSRTVPLTQTLGPLVHSSIYIAAPLLHIQLLLLLLKKVSSARLGESDIHPISPKTTAPQYQPIDRKKRKGKRVEDYSRDRAA